MAGHSVQSARILGWIAISCSSVAVIGIALLIPLLSMTIDELQSEFDMDLAEVKSLSDDSWKNLISMPPGKTRNIRQAKSAPYTFDAEQVGGQQPGQQPDGNRQYQIRGDNGRGVYKPTAQPKYDKTDSYQPVITPAVVAEKSTAIVPPEITTQRPTKPSDCKCCEEPASTTCPSGPPGSPGSPGADGMDGLPGDLGKPGEDASSGGGGGLYEQDIMDMAMMQICSACPPGPMGPPGPNGQTGRRGQHGSNGPSGMPGRSGKTGTPGLDGKPGARGPLGQDGPNGPPGQDGIQGGQGQPGPKGLNGEPGQPGMPGMFGMPAMPGEAGMVGEPGTPGQSGAAGDNGLPGPAGGPGFPGPDGQYCPCPNRNQNLDLDEGESEQEYNQLTNEPAIPSAKPYEEPSSPTSKPYDSGQEKNDDQSDGYNQVPKEIEKPIYAPLKTSLREFRQIQFDQLRNLWDARAAGRKVSKLT